MNGDWNEDFSGHVDTPAGIPASEVMPDTDLSEAIAPEPEVSPFGPSAMRVPLPPMRFPNMADVGLLVVLLLFAALGAAGITGAALHFHLFGVTTPKQAIADVRYQFGGQILWYFLALVGSIILFPTLWHTEFFRGLEWRFGAALRARTQLVGTTIFCLVLAVIDGRLLPGPDNAPIDEVFRRPGTAWFLLFFGTLLAPF
ncbi:MAG TPA: hypothetical protein VF742_04420, partial [Terracidiphilus sp.]